MFEDILTRSVLEKEYVANQKPKYEIARKFNTTVSTINKYLRLYNIPNNNVISKRSRDLTGEKIGRWRVLKKTTKDQFGKSRWCCLCDCGNQKIVNASSLIRATSLSCGCHRRDESYNGYKDISGAYWHKFTKQAVERRYEFDITIEYAWQIFVKQNGKCALSKVDIVLNSNNDKSHLRTASLDRIDSSKGYIEGNIQWVHKTVNIMKNNLSDNDLIWWSQQIVNSNKRKDIHEPDYKLHVRKSRIVYENKKQRISK